MTWGMLKMKLFYTRSFEFTWVRDMAPSNWCVETMKWKAFYQNVCPTYLTFMVRNKFLLPVKIPYLSISFLRKQINGYIIPKRNEMLAGSACSKNFHAKANHVHMYIRERVVFLHEIIHTFWSNVMLLTIHTLTHTFLIRHPMLHSAVSQQPSFFVFGWIELICILTRECQKHHVWPITENIQKYTIAPVADR